MYFSKNNFPFSALLKFLFSSFMCFVFNIDELIFGLNQKGKKGKKKKKKTKNQPPNKSFIGGLIKRS